MVTVEGNEHGNPRKIMDEVVWISHKGNAIGKGMNLVILPPVLSK